MIAANEIDKILRNSIKKDVDRTLQHLPFFREESTKTKLNELLYIWARENFDYRYQQGMSDILAVFVYAFYEESISH
jgi:TBC1 domain family protein 5